MLTLSKGTRTVPATLARTVCRRLGDAGIGLGLARLQLHRGMLDDAESMLANIHHDLQSLRTALECQAEPEADDDTVEDAPRSFLTECGIPQDATPRI